MAVRRSRAGQRGGLAFELAIGLSIILVVCAVCAGIGYGLIHMGWHIPGRLVWTLPALIPGVMNLWIAWRPGDQHEAKPMARLSCVVRGVAMVGPLVVFAASPGALPEWLFFAVFFGGMVLSFLILGLERGDGGGDRY